ncbi:MAG: ion channel [Actinomycetota bacterium]|nr:ion channel [Actinomycetota bacterium]
MEWLLVAVGVFLILVGLLDVFFTVLHYDGYGFLSSRLYNKLFSAVRFLTRPLPRRYRALGLSMAAPLMVPVTITVWIFLVSLGYALIYYAGMGGRTFSFSDAGLEPSFMEALYFSGVAVSTLGFGDITPTSSLYQAIVVSEALVGFGILTLAISYIIGVYGVLQRLGVLAAGLHHQAQDTDNPWTILAPHFQGSKPVALESHLMELHRGLVEVYEGMRRYPIVYYYHSRRAYRSLPYTFRTMGGMAGALRWGLPTGHLASQTPWLPTLITGLTTLMVYMDERFLSEHLEDAPKPVSFEGFEAALIGQRDPPDWFSKRFLEMERWMRDLAHLEEAPDAKEAYERYSEWLPFAHHVRAFFEASAKDLGYELKELAHGPGEKLY